MKAAAIFTPVLARLLSLLVGWDTGVSLADESNGIIAKLVF
jgi:hypothetical protein